MVMVLVFAGIFMTILTSFVVFIVTQSRLIQQRVQFDEAGQIAEAGINYYKWYLSHYPNATTTSYTGVYTDPEGAAIGQYVVSVASSTYCGEVASLKVTSTGNTYAAPTVKRTVSAAYARPNVAEYSFVINSNVWVGDDVDIVGAYHTNGGVRMDGTNNSTVSSGQSTWSCDASFGCSPTSNKAGVFTTTANPNTALFQYPVAPIDFAGITVDLSRIQQKAQTGGGLYFGPSAKAGYQVIFNNNGTVTVNKVNSKENEPNGNAWGYYINAIKQASLVGTYTIPKTCPVLYFEDQVWLEGQVQGNVTIAAADVDTSGVDPSIILNNNITYANSTSSLLAVSEQDMLVGFIVPNDMTLNGIFIAQKGAFGRNYYDTADMPTAWDQYVKRNSLTINGTVVSNGRVGTKWLLGNTYVSGFANRTISYDRNAIVNPPPYTPATSDVFQFSDWRDAN